MLLSLSLSAAAHPQVLQRRVEPLAVLAQALLAVVDVAVDLDHLRLQHTDSEQERLRKRRKVKALKQKIKQKEQDEARDSQKNSWLAFQNKGAKRKVVGSMKASRKESIFASPDTVDGKVGVTGSGKDMTEFGERKKYKLAPPLP